MKPKYYQFDLNRISVILLLASITYFFSDFLNNVFPSHLRNLVINTFSYTPDCLERKPPVLNSSRCAVMKHMHLFTW